MKKITILIAWLLSICPTVFAQTYYLENLKVENRLVEKHGKTVKVSMDVNLDELRVNKQHSIMLVPTLVSADGKKELELKPITINGKVRDKVFARQQSLGYKEKDENQISLKHKKGQQQTINYETEVPFDKWMVNGQLDLRAYVTGCAQCNEGDEKMTTGGILAYNEPQFIKKPAMQPQEETVKLRAEVRTARLQFRQDSYNILPSYRDNKDELDKVKASIDEVRDNEDLKITGIYVVGYTSPEASVEYNMELSKRRAQNFTDYVQKQNPELDKSLWHVSWKGEDWAGLREEVVNTPKLLKQKEVLEIIDKCQGDLDACEKKLQELLPATIYERLLNELYPSLRRNEYRIEYNVRNYSLQETKDMLNSRPDLLSVAEIQKVADSYGHNSDQYRETMKVAVKTYPENKEARYNAALAEIETSHNSEAVNLLQNVTDGDLLNLLGIAYWNDGQLRKSEEAFVKAQQAGCSEATQNLEMLREAIDMIGE